ncbi:hypothetical protein GN956_G18602 [Arapaima gigas]
MDGPIESRERRARARLEARGVPLGREGEGSARGSCSSTCELVPMTHSKKRESGRVDGAPSRAQISSSGCEESPVQPEGRVKRRKDQLWKGKRSQE